MSGGGLGGLGRGSSPAAGRRSRAGSAVSAPPPRRAGSGSVRREPTLRPGPLCTERGLRGGWGLRRRRAGLGSRLRPGPARPGLAWSHPEGAWGVREGGGGERHLSEQIHWNLERCFLPAASSGFATAQKGT